jgi:hypothetical protein
MRVTFERAALLGTVAAAALITTPAAAQENSNTSPATQANQQTQSTAAEASDQTIIVTARRRNELLLDVPVAVTAFSGEQLDRQGALDITDVADTTPNVTLEVSRGTNSTLTPFIRGIGRQDPVAGFEQGVGLYLDDVYLNRPQAAVLDIYDVERRAGRPRCSIAGCSSRRRSSMPNIRTSRCRDQPAAPTRAGTPASAASRPTPARRGSAASSSRPMPAWRRISQRSETV